jgi:hypothetical protein
MSLNAAPHDLLRRLLASGGADKEAAAWAAAGLAAWLRSGGSLPLTRCLGLPTTPRKTQQLLRDAWIREAARYIEERTAWRRACKLAEEVKHFESRMWPHWRGERLPPAHATPAQACLFFAKTHSQLPATARRLRSIFNE